MKNKFGDKVQAVLILGHKNVDQITDLCRNICGYFDVYLHMDKKTNVTDEQISSLKQLGVHYYSRYDVKWGSYSIVRATLLLMRAALDNPQNSYFHLISGQDWPMKDPQTIYDTFEKTSKIYMDYFKAQETVKSGENLLWWVKFYFNYDVVNRRSLFGKIYHRFLILNGRLFRINKLKRYKIDSNDIYAGEEWIDIPRDALKYAVDKFSHDRNLQAIFSSSFCSDEMWLQTVLCNSQFIDRIDKNIHRYISWEHRNGSYPAILDASDYDKINHGDYWWGRKVEKPISDRLIKLISNS